MHVSVAQAYAEMNVLVMDSALEATANPASLSAIPEYIQDIIPSSSSLLQPLSSFNDLSKQPFRYAQKLLKNMAESGLQLPTPIQRHAIPTISAGKSPNRKTLYTLFRCMSDLYRSCYVTLHSPPRLDLIVS